MSSFHKRGLTIERLLELEPLHGARLITGDQNKQKRISRINIMGSPDIDQFVRPEEFVMTTGYLFKDNTIHLKKLIDALHDRGVTGMGIKVERFIDVIPEDLLCRARELSFPIIEIRPQTIFSDVVRVAMEEVFYQESEHLVTLYHRVQVFMDQLNRDHSLPDLLKGIEQMIGNPIVVLDFEEQLTAPLFEQVLEPKECLHLNHTLEAKAGIGKTTISIRDESFQCYCVPLVSEGLIHFVPYIACIETNVDLTEVDCMTLDKVSSMLSIELTNQTARKRIEQKYLNQFVKELVVGDIVSDYDIDLRAHSFDLDLKDKWFQTVILDLEEGVFSDVTAFQLFLKKITMQSHGQVLGTSLDKAFVMLICVDRKTSIPIMLQMIETAVQRIVKKDGQPPLYQLYGGRAVQYIGHIKQSFNEAYHVKTIAKHNQLTTSVLNYDDLHVYQLLYHLPQTSEVAHYLEGIIGPLRSTRNDVLYFETLDVFFQKNKNVRATADALYAHYNTIVYRLEKISALLGIDLQDAEACLELQLALKLRFTHLSKGG
ncbi:PucR family transcriptional regulator [Shouchella lehensis]|uniref:Purine catabolism regulatory protein n=1 Tax=Shouchella lehensis G1 TaxID=1246626 RepID=A0A060LYC1_9BACI|nr:PucR family transcriptional regulator [Shouchella lehensis]AIC93288.1 purine catabolism regulatory protein [Shouchella lehensis G1]